MYTEDRKGCLNRNEENAEKDVETENVPKNKKDDSDQSQETVSSSCRYSDLACSESMPSSESNKENQTRNSQSLGDLDFDLDFLADNSDKYENPDQIPLPQLLKMHVKQLVSGFEFGEATKRRAQENMKSARDKTISENKNSESDGGSDSKPCCSKTLSESNHKTPHSRKRQRLTEVIVNMINSDKEFSKASRRVPDCFVDHPDCAEVWIYMVYKEEAALKLRNPRLFTDFKSVTPRMRAILLDWLMEVCSVYHLRRVTYYLSLDYFDRFLSIRPDIPKSLLQLVGITCLYIAAKVEEVYPPNLHEFSYVCDGACKASEMISCELLILNSLGWEVVLTTPSDWLNLYMQLHFKSKDIIRANLNMDFNKDFVFPQYSAYQFTRASQLMDLFSLDPGFLKFGYSVIAAAAMYFMYDETVAVSVSGFTIGQLQPCIDYMEVFNAILKDAPDPRLHSCLGGPQNEETNQWSSGLMQRIQNGPQNENYSFQTHVAFMDYFEKATIYRLTKYMNLKNQEEETPLPQTPNPVDEIDERGGEDVTPVKEDDLDTQTAIVSPPCQLGKHVDVEGTPFNQILNSSARDEDNCDIEDSNVEQNMISIDEIFELILNQDYRKDADHSQ